MRKFAHDLTLGVLTLAAYHATVKAVPRVAEKLTEYKANRK